MKLKAVSKANNLVNVNGLIDDSSEESKLALKALEIEAGFAIEQECPVEDIDLNALELNDAQYNAYVGSLIGINNINKVCLCPDGQGFCDWSSKMFEQFIVDLTKWDLISIQILDCTTGDILSSSSLNGVTTSISGNFALVTMSNPSVLQNLHSGQEIKAVFQWREMVNGVEVIRCIILRNIIPDPNKLVKSISSSQILEEQEKGSKFFA